MTKFKPCFFCETYKKQKDIAFTSKYFFARFDQNPVSPGHLLIVPKKHTLSLIDLSAAQWNELMTVVKLGIKTIEKTNKRKLYLNLLKKLSRKHQVNRLKLILKMQTVGRKADGYNFGVNDGEAAGRTVHHLHLHIIPRYKGDVNNARGGIRNVIPRLGNYK